ncbi:unnamed protein product [Miscanthus lutarioriparius]|uniref:tRNA-splicing endonuclease subunit Sen54 N-terminal domain-containing protein n=1 Tax=Miscanthus lutarioriparius TaxID=422564 RepID=A0A811P9Y7_9POAL|nr:unnamed protein product [Miscanthus lutarioriparius]
MARSRAPAPAVGNDDAEEQHLNPFLDAAPSASSRLQFRYVLRFACRCSAFSVSVGSSSSWDCDFTGFCGSGHRNVASRARWVEEIVAAEVVESRGKPWLATGVTRAGKLCYNVEEIGFLAERGALILLSDNDETIGIEGIYEKLVGGNYGCSWDAFQAYKHLKSLGYIVGRFGVPWTMKHSGTCDTDQTLNRVDGASNDITKLLKEMQIGGISPSFEVYLPNSKFKKSSPGSPTFLLCLLR